MTGTGAIELPLLVFQLFFMLAGVVGGIKVTDDVQRWRAARTKSVDG